MPIQEELEALHNARRHERQMLATYSDMERMHGIESKEAEAFSEDQVAPATRAIDDAERALAQADFKGPHELLAIVRGVLPDHLLDDVRETLERRIDEYLESTATDQPSGELPAVSLDQQALNGMTTQEVHGIQNALLHVMNEIIDTDKQGSFFYAIYHEVRNANLNRPPKTAGDAFFQLMSLFDCDEFKGYYGGEEFYAQCVELVEREREHSGRPKQRAAAE